MNLLKKKDNDISNTHRKYINSGYKTIKIKCNSKTKTLTRKGGQVTDDNQEGEEGELEKLRENNQIN